MTAVTAEGMEMARRLMSNGWLNRYQPPLVEAEDEEAMDYLLQCERELAAYIGTKYCIGLNSGASAIFLALKCGGLPHGGKVLSNAFTFNAVPASIVHAGGEPVLVECDENFCIDLADLERQVVATGAKYLVLSYMRGRIPDMDAVMELVAKHELYLIEDAAHAYGTEWEGRKIGSFGKSSTISTQALTVTRNPNPEPEGKIRTRTQFEG